MAVSTLGTVLATHFSGFLGRRFPFPLANTYTSVASRIRDLSRNVILRGFCGRVPSCSILYSRSNDQLVLPSRIQHGMQATLRSTCTFTPLTKKVCPNMELKMLPSVGGVRFSPTLNQIRRNKPRTKNSKSKKYIPRAERILVGPQRKGVCVKVFIRKPKKPNSAQRKCALLRLSNGKTITAYIPREKGQLQEHGVVLFEGGRVQDCPGIKYKIIRGKLDMN